MDFLELEKLVVRWGKDRGLYYEGLPERQLIKLEEEFLELQDAIDSDNLTETLDALGDMMVVMTHIAAHFGVSLAHCYQLAYNEIKDRKGKLVNGIFVKEN